MIQTVEEVKAIAENAAKYLRRHIRNNFPGADVTVTVDGRLVHIKAHTVGGSQICPKCGRLIGKPMTQHGSGVNDGGGILVMHNCHICAAEMAGWHRQYRDTVS